MNAHVVECLRCPLCASRLTEADAGSGRALRCLEGHSFDIARQGYVNLHLQPPAHTGDTAEMLAARAAFLVAGHYEFVSTAIVHAAVASCRPGSGDKGARLVIDAGSGTGHYLARVLDAMPDLAGLALDVSKAALRRAARVHSRASGALCDVWGQWPLAAGAAGLILSVFAPRNASEFQRVLAADGALIVVTPGAGHLAELVDALGLLSVDPDKDKAVAAALGGRFDQIADERHDRVLRLAHAEVHSLVSMGPSAWHVDPAALATSIGALPEVVTVTASVRVGSYRPRPR